MVVPGPPAPASDVTGFRGLSRPSRGPEDSGSWGLGCRRLGFWGFPELPADTRTQRRLRAGRSRRPGPAASSRQEAAAPGPERPILAVTARRRSRRSDLNGPEAAPTARPEAALLTGPDGGSREGGRGSDARGKGRFGPPPPSPPPRLECGQAAGAPCVRAAPSDCPARACPFAPGRASGRLESRRPGGMRPRLPEGGHSKAVGQTGRGDAASEAGAAPGAGP